MAIKMIKQLHTALVDTRAAYEVALKETEDQDVASLCKEMISRRHTDHMGLHQALVLAGAKPDEDGSFMSMVHETVIHVRAAFTGVGRKPFQLSLAKRAFWDCTTRRWAKRKRKRLSRRCLKAAQNLLSKIVEMEDCGVIQISMLKD